MTIKILFDTYFWKIMSRLSRLQSFWTLLACVVKSQDNEQLINQMLRDISEENKDPIGKEQDIRGGFQDRSKYNINGV